MSAQCEITAKQAAGSPMGVFERYLTLWVFLCIAAGIGLGQVFPGFFQFVGPLGNRADQSAGGRTDLAHDHPDAAQDRPARPHRRPETLAGRGASPCS